MQITINNESYNFEENTSLETAIDILQLEDKTGIALALNEEIIPRSKWNETTLTNEDKIIIIGAVAGGNVIMKKCNNEIIFNRNLNTKYSLLNTKYETR